MNAGSSATLAGLLFVAAVVPPSAAAAAGRPQTPIEEARTAAIEHPGVLERYGGLYQDQALVHYVRGIGRRLAADMVDRQYSYRFTVLDSPDALAFAVAGGYIYVTRTMVGLANSEAEIAAVLAHEMAHVELRHSAQRLEIELEHEAEKRILDDQSLNAFTREQEFEADVVGVQMLATAGYDPMAQARFLQAVGDYGQLSGQTGLRPKRSQDPETHPSLANRIERASAAALDVVVVARPWPDRDGVNIAAYDVPAVPLEPDGMVRRNEFLAAIDRIVYGPMPSDGLAVGQTFMDAKARFSFDLAPGFRFTRVGRTILAEGPNGSAFRFDIQFRWRRSSTTMVEYLRRNAGRSLELDTLEGVTIGGMEAAVATARVNAAKGSANLYLMVVRFSRNTVFRFQYALAATLSDTMMDRVKESTASLRVLTTSEATNWKPMHLEVVTANADTTLASLAAQMRFVGEPMEWLLTLNGLQPGTKILPGQKFKVLTH